MTTPDKREQFRQLLRQKAMQAPAAPHPATPTDWQRFADVGQFAEITALRRQKQVLADAGLANPYFRPNETVTGATATVGGRELISYSSYNYLGLSGDPRVNRAAQDAIMRYGTSVSASRVATGEKPLHRELEREIADLLGTEDAVVMVSGHATNVTVIGHLFGARDLILYDALAHNSIVQGALLAGARHLPFAHNDAAALEALLTRHRHEHERVLIAIEGVYSMDGDIADVAAFVALKRRFHTLLLVDEAHSLGVLGHTGRGIGEHAGLAAADVDLWMGTLSKALASCGGYIAGDARLIEYLRYTAPGFLYSVGMTPPNTAAALAAGRIMLAEPERVQRLQENAATLLDLARAAGLNTGRSAGSAVIPVIVGDSIRCLLLAQALFDRGINVHPILHPAVPEHDTRLRFFVTSEHTKDQLHQTITALAQALAALPASGAGVSFPSAPPRR